jgi:hypothetical protein
MGGNAVATGSSWTRQFSHSAECLSVLSFRGSGIFIGCFLLSARQLAPSTVPCCPKGEKLVRMRHAFGEVFARSLVLRERDFLFPSTSASPL